MPFAAVDERTALTVIDLQAGIVPLKTAHPVEGVVAGTVEPLGAFRERALPVVLVDVAGTPGGRTDIGGASTSTFEEGFHVSLPVDATTDRTPATHEHSIAHIFPRIAETGTTEQFLSLLEEAHS